VSAVSQAYDAEQLQGEGFLAQLWRFARPHTIVGTTLSLLALWTMAAGLFAVSNTFGNDSGISGTLSPTGVIGARSLALTWLACIGANVYIVGLNQLTDVPLDRINKPYLPLASGAWSMRTGWIVVFVSLAASLVATALVNGLWLWWTVCLSLALGTAYSLPPFRLKRFSFWAAFCIIAVRSLIVNVLLFAHVANWASDWRDLPPPVWLLTGVMFAFSIAIAWFKDMPDLAGDAAHGVETLTVRLGRKWVLRSGSLVLIGVLLAAAVAAYTYPMLAFSERAAALGQVIIAALFAWSAWRVNLEHPGSLRRFYLTLWGLFFLEYIWFWLLPGSHDALSPRA